MHLYMRRKVAHAIPHWHDAELSMINPGGCVIIDENIYM